MLTLPWQVIRWIADCIAEEGMARVPHPSQIALRFCNSAGRLAMQANLTRSLKLLTSPCA